MSAFEKLGLFYLGKKVQPDSGQLSTEYLLYDSKDLTTHAVCVGMTGSGKTGLCVGLIEEAAIDGIPSIIIDPKGDLGNLMLTFPDFRAEDFLPWINQDEARRKDLSPEEYARQQADLWRKGLSEWEQDGERIRRLRQATETTIYTPGSSAGIPVNILQSFSSPGKEVREDADQMRERIQAVISGLLGMLGIDADPLQSREHILLSHILEYAWHRGGKLALSELIRSVQSPPLQRIGVFELESFYPEKERFKLAMALNNLLAAPGFKTWLEGRPLDIDKILYGADGKPQTAIFSIAHLADSERMFFVTLLLNQLLGWMRMQSGTTSLRALLYMDEVFGFLPPIGEPASKKPLLTLLKQARAFGLGVVLSTQNPVDLDYKGLSNAGTWFIGRLQTENDRNRLIDGLTSAGSSGYDKKTLNNMIAALQKREFLMQNVHEKQPLLFRTRWVLSYLRGPLTRDQIKTLMQERQEGEIEMQPATASAANSGSTTPSSGGNLPQHPPQLPPEIRQYFAPASTSEEICYHPYLIAGGEVQIFSSRYGVAESQPIAHALPLADDSEALSWNAALQCTLSPALLGNQPAPRATFLPIPSRLLQLRTYDRLDRSYETHVYRNCQLELWKSNMLKLTSRPGESERQFRIRLAQASHEKRDLDVERLRRKYAGKMDTLERQLLTARQRIEREAEQFRQRKLDMALSVGTGLLGAFLGGRARSGVTRAARSATRMSRDRRDIERAKDKAAQLEARLQALNQELQEEIGQIAARYDSDQETLQQIVIRPKKSDVLQKFYGILWVPFGRGAGGGSGPLVHAFFKEENSGQIT